MNRLTTLTTDQILERVRQRPATEGLLLMYSTWLGGWTRDAALMVAPVDDHQFHRGDGVFEAIKFVDGAVYLLDAHLDRLERSSQALSLPWPMPRSELRDILLTGAREAGRGDGILRLFLSRGPGQFSPNPYDSVGAQIYLIVTEMKRPSSAAVEKGVKIGLSEVPVKEARFAQVKSCNYLANVLMKKEAVDRKLDFVVGVESDGWLTESATENFVWVDNEGFLRRPGPDRILAGTTMLRAFELSAPLVSEGLLKGAAPGRLRRDQLSGCREMMMIGTTLDVLSVTECEGRPVGDGRPGPVAKRLREILIQDQKSGSVAAKY